MNTPTLADFELLIRRVIREEIRAFRADESQAMDAAYLASLPVEELKRIQQAKWNEQKLANKQGRSK